jgi:predicted DNA-binding transcriptional regulator YafY
MAASKKGGRPLPKMNRTVAMAEITTRLRNYLTAHPDLSQEEVMKAVNIGSEASLYSLLAGLKNDREICKNGEFLIRKDGNLLNTAWIEMFLAQNRTREKDSPKLAERLLYLYWSLHNGIPDGGLSFKAIQDIYLKLFEKSGDHVPADSALRRMIYRDMKAFEKLGIWIDRSEVSKKYCLRDEYLPKLTSESAAAVYVSMLLYRGTLLDEATLGAKEQLEKSFFKNFPERTRVLKDRIYVLGDTLAHPQEFGNILGQLILAVGESYRIKLVYMNNEGEESARILEPLGLLCKRNVWYLIARKQTSQEIRTFRVDQILHLNVRQSEKFTYPVEFSLTTHIGCSWGVFYNDEVQTIKLKFSRQVAHRVKNLCYHPSQKIAEECDDGSVILAFEACGLVEMQSWILQWGTQVEVLEPVALREEIMRIAQAVAAQYGNQAAYRF